MRPWIWIAVIAVAAAAGFVTARGRQFRRGVAADAHALWTLQQAPTAPLPLDGLPPPVRRYLEVSGASRRAPVSAVRLRHGGTFRTSLHGKWFPIRGEQYFSSDPPGFVWFGRIRTAPGVHIVARDRSFRGEGEMLVKVASTFTVADSRGPEMDEGALLRLLSEMVWFPTALLDGRYVSWAPADEASARAALRVGGREVSGTFRFGRDGLPSEFVAERYRDGAKEVRTPWAGELGDFREVDGLRVPFRLEARWIVDGQPQPYARWQVEQIEYDRPEPY